MTAPLSQDLRRRLVRAVDEGSSARAAAARFQVSVSAAIKLVRRVRQTGSTEPTKIGGYRKPLLAGHDALLRDLTAAKPGITLAEIREALMAPCVRRVVACLGSRNEGAWTSSSGSIWTNIQGSHRRAAAAAGERGH